MDVLQEKVGSLYLKFLAAAFGSALITSIYGLVDMAMVGQYHGPVGVAAMAVIAPIWNIIYSLGLLVGIGASVLYSIEKGRNTQTDKANGYFTAAIFWGIIIALLAWIGLWIFEKPLLQFFGADETLLQLSSKYVFWIKLCVPVFLFSQILSAFLRNDSNPALATKAVLAGGIANVLGDYVFVFQCDMGISGAGLATALGAILSVIVMSSHFLSSKNTLKIHWTGISLKGFSKIVKTGFSTFFIDIAMGILSILFNRQIMSYLNTDALAVYGVIINISTFVQCCAYGVGQASQPILSQNYGAAFYSHIKQLVRYNVWTSAVISIIWLILTMAVPNAFIYLFMSPTQSVLEIAPFIIRCYSLSFLFLPLNIYATYYFQSVMEPMMSFVVSVTRGMLLSGALILCLPILFHGQGLWFAMPITECIVSIMVVFFMKKTFVKMN